MYFDMCAADRLYQLELHLRETREAILADDKAFCALLTILSIIAASVVALTVFLAAEVSLHA